MDVSSELLQEAAAVSAEAERVREAAGELEAAADEVQSLLQAVAERFDPAIWSGESARLAEDQVHRMRDRLHSAAAELDGVAWSMLLRAARLEDSAEQLRTQAALAPEVSLGGGPFGSPLGS